MATYLNKFAYWLMRFIPHSGAKEIAPEEMEKKVTEMKERIELRRKKQAK